MPCFIVLVFTVPHRCYVFYKTKGKTLHQQKITTCFAVTHASMQWSGIKSAISPWYSCILSTFP